MLKPFHCHLLQTSFYESLSDNEGIIRFLYRWLIVGAFRTAATINPIVAVVRLSTTLSIADRSWSLMSASEKSAMTLVQSM